MIYLFNVLLECWSDVLKNKQTCFLCFCTVTLQQKEHPSDRSDPPLQKVVFPSDFGTLHPRERRHNTQGPKHDGSNHERPRGLNVPCGGNEKERHTRPSSLVSLIQVTMVSASFVLKAHHPGRCRWWKQSTWPLLLWIQWTFASRYWLHVSGFTEVTPLVCYYLCFTVTGLLNKIPFR